MGPHTGQAEQLKGSPCIAKTRTAVVNDIVNVGLVNAMPNMQQTLLQFTTLVSGPSS